MEFFTSDTHFNHAKIIEYCNRPFFCVEEMNEAIIENWNKKVGKDDTVFHLGDFGFGNIKQIIDVRRRLNGRIILIRGNHDARYVKIPEFNSLFHGGKLYNYYSLRLRNEILIMSHYAFRVWDRQHYGSWHLYGHSHGTLRDGEEHLSIDVGVDSNKFAPLSFHEVSDIMSKRNFTPDKSFILR